MLNKFKKRLLLLALTAAVGCSAFGLTMAYMTDSEQNTNVITVGDVTVDLIETKWEPANGINPAVTNKGSLDCWIFLKVKSPKKNIITVDNILRKKIHPQIWNFFLLKQMIFGS